MNQTQARRILKHFPWPKDLPCPQLDLAYLGMVEGYPVYAISLRTTRINIVLRHPTPEGALRTAIDVLLAEHGRMEDSPPIAAIAREAHRLAN